MVAIGNDTLPWLVGAKSSLPSNIFESANSPEGPNPTVVTQYSPWLGCIAWLPIQKSALFQLANVCFFIAYTSPFGKYGTLFLHCTIILGYLLYATWAWNVVCAPSIFTWAFVFVIMNIGQILIMLYQQRTVRFLPDLESLYIQKFQPFQVSRKEFGKITSSDYAHLVTLYNGDSYANENVTRTDRLALLLRGKMQVSYQNRPLHCIFMHEFLDSAEFHSSAAIMTHNRFTVSITACTQCELIIWERADIEYLMIKYPRVRTIVESLVAKDILLKLSLLGNQIPGWRSNQPCDLRLAQDKTFVASLRMRSRSPSMVELERHISQHGPVESEDAIVNRAPARSIRKSPLSMPCAANIELTQWYHAFLKRELIYDKGGYNLPNARMSN